MPFRFVPFRDRLLNRYVKRADVQPVQRGEAVIETGDPATAVLLLLEGHLRVLAPSDRAGSSRVSRIPRTVDLALPMEILGLEALVDDARLYRWSVEAGEASRVARLEGRAVRRVLRRSERTLDALLDALLDRTALARRLGPGVAHATAAERLWWTLQALARRSGEPDPGDPWSIRARVTHRDLGDLAGLHRSTVTTQLNDWLYRGLLESEGRRWIIPALEPERL